MPEVKSGILNFINNRSSYSFNFGTSFSNAVDQQSTTDVQPIGNGFDDDFAPDFDPDDDDFSDNPSNSDKLRKIKKEVREAQMRLNQRVEEFYAA